MKNNEAFTRHKQQIEKSANNARAYRRYDRISRERWLQRNREDAERRKKINPRIVTNDPTAFFDDLIMEQQEQA